MSRVVRSYIITWDKGTDKRAKYETCFNIFQRAGVPSVFAKRTLKVRIREHINCNCNRAILPEDGAALVVTRGDVGELKWFSVLIVCRRFFEKLNIRGNVPVATCRFRWRSYTQRQSPPKNRQGLECFLERFRVAVAFGGGNVF